MTVLSGNPGDCSIYALLQYIHLWMSSFSADLSSVMLLQRIPLQSSLYPQAPIPHCHPLGRDLLELHFSLSQMKALCQFTPSATLRPYARL